MIEYDERTEKAYPGIGQLQIVWSGAFEFWLDEILQIVPPEAEAAAKRKGQVDFFQQLIENMPGISISLALAQAGVQNNSGAKRTKCEERPRRNERIATAI